MNPDLRTNRPLECARSGALRGATRAPGMLLALAAILGVLSSGGYAQSIPLPNGGGDPVPEGTLPARNATTVAIDRAVSVLVATREAYAESTDFVIARRGRSLRFTRSYRSQITYDGPIGMNWSHVFDHRVYLDRGKLAHVDGTRLRVDTYTGQSGLVDCSTPGVYRKARLAGSQWTIRDSRGNLWRFLPIDGTPTSGRLVAMEDRSGNAFTCEYDGVSGRLLAVRDALATAPAAPVLAFAYNAQGKIGSITDFTGRSWSYQYDANGNLTGMTTPVVTGTPVCPADGQANDFPAGRTVEYAYTSGNPVPTRNHNLTAVTYPANAGGGPASVGISYSGDKVSTASLDTSVHSFAAGTPEPQEVAAVVVTDPRGFVCEYGLLASGHARRVARLTTPAYHPSGPAAFVTVREFNAHGETTSVDRPRGDALVAVYDDQHADRFRHGNLLQSRHVPVAGAPGAAADKVLDYLHDPVYQQQTGTAQSGNATVLDYQEGDPASTGLNSYVQDWGLSLVVGGAAIATALGDRNGDGVTDQIAGHVIEETTTTISTGVPAPVQISTYTTYDDFGRTLSRSTGEGSVSAYFYDANGFLETRIEDIDPALPGMPPNAGILQWTRSTPHVHAVSRSTHDVLGRTIAHTDPRGVTTTYEYNSNDQLLLETAAVSTDPTLLDPVLAAMLSAGYANLVTPGYRTYFRYDANGHLVRTDRENVGSGRADAWLTELHAYDAQERLTRIEHEVSAGSFVVTRFFYDRCGNRIKIVHPEGNEETFDHDERGLMVERVAGANDPTTSATYAFAYDANGECIRETGPDDFDGDGLPEATLLVRDGRGRVVETIDPVGTVLAHVFDKHDYLVETQVHGTIGGASPTANDTSNNVLLSLRQPVYDEIGRKIEEAEHVFAPGAPTGLPYAAPDYWSSTGTVHDRDGLVLETTNSTGDSVVFERDGLGRMVAKSDGEGNTWQYAYDQAGHCISVVRGEANPHGSSESKTDLHTYDALGRRVRSVDNLGDTVYFAYDSRGNRVGSASGDGPVMADPLGLAPVSIRGTGNTRRWIHDGLGRVISSFVDLRLNGVGTGSPDLLAPFDPATNPAPAELDLTANPDGMLTSEIRHDDNGNVVEVTTDTQGTIVFEYDAQDRVTKKVMPDGSEMRTTYYRGGAVATHALHDTVGNLFRATLSTYDAGGRLVREDVNVPSGSRVEGTRLTEFEYNGLDLATRITDDNGVGLDSVVTRSYDSRGNVLQDVQNGLAVTSQVGASGSRIGLWYPNGREVRYYFDDRKRISDIQEIDDSSIAHYDYLGARRVGSVTFGNATANSYLTPQGAGDVTGYDAAGRPARVEHIDPTASVSGSYENEYDAAGRRTSEERTITGVGVKSDVLEHDSSGRVTRFENGTALTQEYAYDGDSTWQALSVAQGGNPPTTYAFAADTTFGLSSIAGQGIVHDVAGNRIADPWFLYFYDAYDRLVRIAQRYVTGEEGITLVWYAYDGLDRRIQRGTVAYDIRYLLEGERVVEERDASGNVLAQYVYGNGIDEVVQMLRDTVGDDGLDAHYYLENTLGSVVALTDASGNIVERYGYDAFGAPRFLDASGSQALHASGAPVLRSEWGNPYLFQGRAYESETAEWKALIGGAFGYFTEWTVPIGQYYYRARYLDPVEGRFTGRDPLAVAGNTAIDPWSLTRRVLTDGFIEGPFAAMNNDPANRVDPLGLSTQVIVTEVGGVTDPFPPFSYPGDWYAEIICLNDLADGKDPLDVWYGPLDDPDHPPPPRNPDPHKPKTPGGGGGGPKTPGGPHDPPQNGSGGGKGGGGSGGGGKGSGGGGGGVGKGKGGGLGPKRPKKLPKVGGVGGGFVGGIVVEASAMGAWSAALPMVFGEAQNAAIGAAACISTMVPDPAAVGCPSVDDVDVWRGDPIGLQPQDLPPGGPPPGSGPVTGSQSFKHIGSNGIHFEMDAPFRGAGGCTKSHKVLFKGKWYDDTDVLWSLHCSDGSSESRTGIHPNSDGVIITPQNGNGIPDVEVEPGEPPTGGSQQVRAGSRKRGAAGFGLGGFLVESDASGDAADIRWSVGPYEGLDYEIVRIDPPEPTAGIAETVVASGRTRSSEMVRMRDPGTRAGSVYELRVRHDVIGELSFGPVAPLPSRLEAVAAALAGIETDTVAPAADGRTPRVPRSSSAGRIAALVGIVALGLFGSRLWFR